MKLARFCGCLPMLAMTLVLPAQEKSSASVPSAPVRLPEGVSAGYQISHAPPVYPPDAKAQGVAGTVLLHVTIGKDGAVEDTLVVDGPDMLRDAATDAVKTWRYRPYLLNGAPVEVETNITVNFTLDLPSVKAEGPVRVSSGVIAGLKISGAAPVYSLGVMETHVSGTVVVDVIIGKDGAVKHTALVSGPMALQYSVLQAVKTWRYKPYLLNGKPVEVESTIEVIIKRN